MLWEPLYADGGLNLKENGKRCLKNCYALCYDANVLMHIIYIMIESAYSLR